MDFDQVLVADNPTAALRAAEGLLGLVRSDPESRRLGWRLIIEIARQEAFVASAAHHFTDCVGCAWCTLGVPEPFDLETAQKLETTSSLRSEG